MMVMMMVIMVHTRNYNYNYYGAKFSLVSPAFLKFIEYVLEAAPSILWLQIVVLAARTDDGDDDGYNGAHQELQL